MFTSPESDPPFGPLDGPISPDSPDIPIPEPENVTTPEAKPAEGSQVRPAERVIGHLIIIMAAMMALTLILQNATKHTVNDGSRWDTVWNLVHRNTYRIDGDPWKPSVREPFATHYEGPWWTIDMVALPAPEGGERDGKPKLAYYSSKTPLLPTVVAGLYYVVWKVTDAIDGDGGGGWQLVSYEENETGGLDIQPGNLAGRTLLILVNVIPFVIFLYLYRRMLTHSSYRPVTRVLCLATAALGTYITAYTRTFNNHTVAAICGFIAVYALLRIWYGDKRRWWYFELAGFFAAFAATCELPATALLVAVMLILFFKDAGRTLVHALPAAAIPLAAFFLTNHYALGLNWKGWPLPLPAQVFHHVDESGDPVLHGLYHFDGSYWNHLDPTGIDGQNEPKGIYAAHMLVGHSGIFSLTPIFLLSLVGIVRHLVGKPRSLVGFNAIVLLITVVVLTFYVLTTKNYGGGAQGFRWAIWMIPLWLVALPHGVEYCLQRRFTQTLTLVLFAISVFSTCHAFVGRNGPWSMSWLHWALYESGIVTYR